MPGSSRMRAPDIIGQLPIHRALRNADASVGGIKLMLTANQASIALTDNQGRTPLHVACHAGNLDAAKILIWKLIKICSRLLIQEVIFLFILPAWGEIVKLSLAFLISAHMNMG